jgi:hypothetical protein
LFLCNLNNLKPQLCECDRKPNYFFMYWMNISSSFFFKTLVLPRFLVWEILNIWFHSEMTCTPHTWDTLCIFDLASITSNTHDKFSNSHIFHVLEPLPYKSSNKIIITCNSIYYMVPSLSNDYWDCSNLVCLVNLTLIRWVWSNFLYHLFLMIHCVYQKLIKMFAHQINEFDFLRYQPNAYSTCET